MEDITVESWRMDEIQQEQKGEKKDKEERTSCQHLCGAFQLAKYFHIRHGIDLHSNSAGKVITLLLLMRILEIREVR